jgi:hypothetical protein
VRGDVSVGAICNVSPRPLRRQIVDQRLDDSGIFGRALDQAERMLIAVPIDAEGGDQHEVVADMQAV